MKIISMQMNILVEFTDTHIHESKTIIIVVIQRLHVKLSIWTYTSKKGLPSSTRYMRSAHLPIFNFLTWSTCIFFQKQMVNSFYKQNIHHNVYHCKLTLFIWAHILLAAWWSSTSKVWKAYLGFYHIVWLKCVFLRDRLIFKLVLKLVYNIITTDTRLGI